MFSYILAGELAKPEIQKILIFWEMELSSPKIKNFIFSPKSFFYISKTKLSSSKPVNTKKNYISQKTFSPHFGITADQVINLNPSYSRMSAD